MNIILVGMPGSGKTTVARELKKVTGFRVVDTDALIVERHGEINEIFLKLGEKTFRDYESEIIAEVCKSSGAIISTGGGSVLREENARLMKNCGKIVYLRASVETILKRTATDNSRPLLAGEKEYRAAFKCAGRNLFWLRGYCGGYGRAFTQRNRK